ncbi:helix-turn-helix transcriptional regulator [Vibrio mangrovi]|uniref:Helix-turn-helix transcriptional regulator n=1 Tax=Vibrio mangrovi TaxID=474394 RepID=A0A1Y6IW83_9VIBR|nr:helix-turn-helix transcriptional regulator [Vibrio mangrovi]MDW6004799.1 helix-turn-helix transcriptional regulator [Vibrio mangrovi]SMS01090.1 hypothetical protein VIM7927_02367 [Vibrio mangrovi]
MLDQKNKNIVIASDQEIAHLDEMLRNIDSDIAMGMSYVKRIQGITFNELKKRFGGLSGETLKKYMQQSYSSMRPIHFVAAYSWVTMVPPTSFYYGLKVKEQFRGMDDNAIKVLMCIGRLSSKQFNTILDMIETLLDNDSRQGFSIFKRNTQSKFYSKDKYDQLFPPSVLDLRAFAIDYYRSVAITIKRFRIENNITSYTMAKVLGLSKYQYSVLEDQNKTTPFSISIGARVRLGFNLNSHADFTSEMEQFTAFHQLRRYQHYRDILIVEAFRRLNPHQKNEVAQLVSHLSIKE